MCNRKFVVFFYILIKCPNFYFMYVWIVAKKYATYTHWDFENMRNIYLKATTIFGLWSLVSYKNVLMFRILNFLMMCFRCSIQLLLQLVLSFFLLTARVAHDLSSTVCTNVAIEIVGDALREIQNRCENVSI